MSTRNLNGKKDKLEIPKDFIPEEYTASEILRQYKKNIAHTNYAENLYYSIVFFWPRLKLLYESCSTWKPYQDMLKFFDDKIIQIFPENQRQKVEEWYKDSDVLLRIDLKLDLHRNSNIKLKEVEAARFANFELIKRFNQLMNAIKTNQQNMTTTKRQREDGKFYFAANTRRPPPILPHGYPPAAISHQPGSSATKPMNTNTNLFVGNVITTKKPYYSETITAIQANGQDLGLDFLETLAPDDSLFNEWLRETQKNLLEPDHSDLTLPPKVCSLCSVQTPGI